MYVCWNDTSSTLCLNLNVQQRDDLKVLELNFVHSSLRPSETRTWSARGYIATFDKKLDSCYFVIIAECPVGDTDYVPSKATRFITVKV